MAIPWWRMPVAADGIIPPAWLIRIAVGAVWLYEGLWCKLCRGQPHEFSIVQAVPYFGPRIGVGFLLGLGGIEVAIAGWAVSARQPFACAVVQTCLLVALNSSGLFWARRLIPDPAGMVVKNTAFLVLVWVSSGLGANA
jgi:hypothetical protein